MHAPRSISLLLFLLPLFPFAQDSAPQKAKAVRENGPTFLSPQDSLDFARFLERVDANNDTTAVFALAGDYRLVWHEMRRGSWWVMMRGDGITLQDFQAQPPEGYFPFGNWPDVLGPKCVVILVDQPTGLIRQDRWFFEAP